MFHYSFSTVVSLCNYNSSEQCTAVPDFYNGILEPTSNYYIPTKRKNSTKFGLMSVQGSHHNYTHSLANSLPASEYKDKSFILVPALILQILEPLYVHTYYCYSITVDWST